MQLDATWKQLTGCPRKKFLLGFGSISPATNCEESWDISQMKDDIHRYIFGTSGFLWDNGELKYRQNKRGYQMIEISQIQINALFLKSDTQYCFACISAPDIAQKTACTQIKGDILGYILRTSSPLCNIGEPRYSQNNTGCHILSVGYYYSTFGYLGNMIPCFVLPISRLPNIAQKTTCTQNEAMVVTFHLRYVPAFNNVYILRNL